MTKLFDDEGQSMKVADISREVKARLQTAADADLEMSKKVKHFEKRIDQLEMALPKERGLLEKMKVDCRKLQVEIRQRDAKLATEKENELREDVRSGKIGVVQFHEQMNDHLRKTKIAAETIDQEIRESISAVRAKGMEVLQMETDLAEAKTNFYYSLNFPQESAISELVRMTKELSFRSQEIVGRYRTCQAESEQKSFQLKRAEGKALIAAWHGGGSLADVQGLIFLPEIPDKYLPPLAQVIAEIEAHEAKKVGANTTPAGKQKYLEPPQTYYLHLSFRAGLDQPWTWLCRNDGQPVQMSQEAPAIGLTMSNIPTQGKIAPEV